MFSKVRLLCILALALVQASTLLAQPDPIRFGRVAAEDFDLGYQHWDEDATAVILADYGQTSFLSGGRVAFERHRRIQILTEAGFDWGTHDVIVFGGYGETVSGVRAQTHTLRADGTVDTQALDRRSVFDEDIDGNVRRVRFTLPALAPGVIVEYRYTVNSPSPMYAPDWYFQTTEPTLWSEYRFNVPDDFEYVVARMGAMQSVVQESSRSVGVLGQGHIHRWVMKDIPALREEPYTTTLRDYQTRLRFQLAGFRAPGGRPHRVLMTWPELAGHLMREVYAPHLRSRREIDRVAGELVAESDSDFGKLVAIYDHVRQNMQYTRRYGVVPQKEPREVLEARSGSSSELAFLLISLLRSAGLDANPVLISTRDHGRVVEIYPLVDQFNDVLVHVEVDGRAHLLSPTNAHRPYNILPESALNERGWLVTDSEERWIPIPATELLAQSTTIHATLQSSGSLTGRLAALHDGYAAVQVREDLAQDHDRRAFVREVVFGGVDDVEIEDQAIAGLDRSGQVGVEAGFVLPHFAQSTGDLIFFNPIVTGRIEANPFRLRERTYPVDFGYPRSYAFQLRLTLPEGYTLVDPPASVQLRHAGGGATYRRSVRMEEDVLVVQTQLLISRVTFPTPEYADLREFFAQMISSDEEQIVLTRAQTATPETSVPGDESGS